MIVPSAMDFAWLPERVRAFIALRLEAAVDEAMAGLIDRWHTASDGIRWVSRSNFHLTLFFLGPSVPREHLSPIAEALGAIAAETAPFEVAARGVGVFPNPGRPRIIWVGLHSEELVRLAERVAKAAERCGFPAQARTYSPHLTIGRVRTPGSRARLRQMLAKEAETGFGVSRIERIALYRSELGVGSAVYRELADFALGG